MLVIYILLNQDSTLTWCSVEKDHLGSNRVVMEETPGINRLQINHYYPFGNTFGEYNHCDENTDLQRYKFNGKELDLVHGLPLTSDISIMIILYEKTENIFLTYFGFVMHKEK